MQVLAVATSAMVAAGKAVNLRAHNIVNAETPHYRPAEPVFSSLGGIGGGVAVFAQDVGNRPVNLISETLGMMGAAHQYKAAANLIRLDEERAKAFFSAVT